MPSLRRHPRTCRPCGGRLVEGTGSRSGSRGRETRRTHRRGGRSDRGQESSVLLQALRRKGLESSPGSRAQPSEHLNARTRLRGSLESSGIAQQEGDRGKPTETESISAVESLCQVIAGKTATLGQALKTVKDAVGLHPALEKAVSALYGYANDAGGIRHAMIDPSSYRCDFEDAKYMLVACSGFNNYLVGKAAKAGIKLN